MSVRLCDGTGGVVYCLPGKNQHTVSQKENYAMIMQ